MVLETLDTNRSAIIESSVTLDIYFLTPRATCRSISIAMRSHLRLRTTPRPRQLRRQNQAKKLPDLELRPDDFDNVHYKVEVVHVPVTKRQAALAASARRLELLETAFVLFVGAIIVGGSVFLGVESDLSTKLAWGLLPMILFPMTWVAVLYGWERAWKRSPTSLLVPARPPSQSQLQPNSPAFQPQ